MTSPKLPKKKIIAVTLNEFLNAGPVKQNRRASDSAPNATTAAAMQEARSMPYANPEQVYKAMGLDKQVEKKGLLQRAHETITGPRQADYGDKLQNFSQIAMLFQGTLATKLLPDSTITAEDVALLMMQVKIARLAKSPDHKDSILDVAGYAGCYDFLQEERSAGSHLDGAIYDSRKYQTRAG